MGVFKVEAQKALSGLPLNPGSQSFGSEIPPSRAARQG